MSKKAGKSSPEKRGYDEKQRERVAISEMPTVPCVRIGDWVTILYLDDQTELKFIIGANTTAGSSGQEMTINRKARLARAVLGKTLGEEVQIKELAPDGRIENVREFLIISFADHDLSPEQTKEKVKAFGLHQG